MIDAVCWLSPYDSYVDVLECLAEEIPDFDIFMSSYNVGQRAAKLLAAMFAQEKTFQNAPEKYHRPTIGSYIKLRHNEQGNWHGRLHSCLYSQSV